MDGIDFFLGILSCLRLAAVGDNISARIIREIRRSVFINYFSIHPENIGSFRSRMSKGYFLKILIRITFFKVFIPFDLGISRKEKVLAV